MLTVSRAVVQIHPRFHPDNGRFLVKPYPKDKGVPPLQLSAQITAKLEAHAAGRGLDRDDLLFQAPEEAPHECVPRLSADPDAPLGRTAPNAAGHRLDRLSDHSALTADFTLQPPAGLTVTSPVTATEPATLF